MRADKPDANKAAIVSDLRERGYIWIDVGGSVDGIAIGYSHNTNSVSAVLVEIKHPKRHNVFTASEKKLQDVLTDRGYQHVYLVATCTEDILKWFGAI